MSKSNILNNSTIQCPTCHHDDVEAFPKEEYKQTHLTFKCLNCCLYFTKQVNELTGDTT